MNILHSKIVVFFIVIFINNFLHAQIVDYNRIILPNEIDSLDMQEKLVQLAWNNNPENIILDKQKEILVNKYKLQKSSFLNRITIQGNLNEAVINPPENFNNNIFFPRYNFSVVIPLGIISEQKYNNRIARLNTEVAEENIKLKKLQIRALVIERYQDFLFKRNQYKIMQELLEEEYSRHLLVEDNFKNGKTSLEDYSISLNNYNSKLIVWYQAESDFKISKAQLEMLTGVFMEDL